MSSTNKYYDAAMNADEFFRRLDHHKLKHADQQFALLIGAGCSRDCDIKTASELVEKWLERLKQINAQPNEKPLETWLQDIEYDPNNPAKSYSEVFKALHPHTDRLPDVSTGLIQRNSITRNCSTSPG